MTIDISELIDTPAEDFGEKLAAFQARHPHLFKEADVADAKRYKVVAVLDHLTLRACREMDGCIVTEPTVHGDLCRCTFGLVEGDTRDPIDDLVTTLEALLLDPDRDSLTLRAEKNGGLRISWRSKDDEENILSLDRIERFPRLHLPMMLETMRDMVNR